MREMPDENQTPAGNWQVWQQSQPVTIQPWDNFVLDFWDWEDSNLIQESNEVNLSNDLDNGAEEETGAVDSNVIENQQQVALENKSDENVSEDLSVDSEISQDYNDFDMSLWDDLDTQNVEDKWQEVVENNVDLDKSQTDVTDAVEGINLDDTSLNGVQGAEGEDINLEETVDSNEIVIDEAENSVSSEEAFNGDVENTQLEQVDKNIEENVEESAVWENLGEGGVEDYIEEEWILSEETPLQSESESFIDQSQENEFSDVSSQESLEDVSVENSMDVDWNVSDFNQDNLQSYEWWTLEEPLEGKPEELPSKNFNELLNSEIQQEVEVKVPQYDLSDESPLLETDDISEDNTGVNLSYSESEFLENNQVDKLNHVEETQVEEIGEEQQMESSDSFDVNNVEDDVKVDDQGEYSYEENNSVENESLLEGDEVDKQVTENGWTESMLGNGAELSDDTEESLDSWEDFVLDSTPVSFSSEWANVEESESAQDDGFVLDSSMHWVDNVENVDDSRDVSEGMITEDVVESDVAENMEENNVESYNLVNEENNQSFVDFTESNQEVSDESMDDKPEDLWFQLDSEVIENVEESTWDVDSEGASSWENGNEILEDSTVGDGESVEKISESDMQESVVDEQDNQNVTNNQIVDSVVLAPEEQKPEDLAASIWIWTPNQIIKPNPVENINVVKQQEVKEVQSTLSLDQILDTELLSNPNLKDNSTAVPVNTVSNWGFFSNKRLVWVLAWVGIFLLASFVIVLAFPWWNGERNPNEIVEADTWISVDIPEPDGWHWSADELWENSTLDNPIEELGVSNSSWSWDHWAASWVFFPSAGDTWDEPTTYEPEPYIYTSEEILWDQPEEIPEVEEVSIDKIRSDIFSFKWQAEIYYSAGQSTSDKQLMKYATQMKYLCDNYQARIDAWEWIDAESYSIFKTEQNSIVSKINAYMGWWDELIVIQNLEDESYFEGKEEILSFITGK